MNKLYYIVEGKSSNENSIDAVIDGVNYSLIKIGREDAIPTGTKVTEITREEYKANLASVGFGGMNGPDFRDNEIKFCEEIASFFASMVAGQPVADADALFTALEKASHRISRGQATLAHYQFNLIDDAIVDASLKMIVNEQFNNHFERVPRSLN